MRLLPLYAIGMITHDEVAQIKRLYGVGISNGFVSKDIVIFCSHTSKSISKYMGFEISKKC